MNISELRYLVALDEHRHFGRAAQACFVSQPTLSTQLKKLERELGVELVERNPGQVLITQAGKQVLAHARAAISEIDQIVKSAKRFGRPQESTITLGLFPTLAPYLLPHVFPQIRALYPQLELLIVEEKSETVTAQIQSGELDAGILATPVPGDLATVELFTEEFVLAVPKDHPLASSPSPTAVTVLTGQDLMLLQDGHCLRTHALEVCALAGARERRGFQATSLETLRHMVAAGMGITLLPRLAVSPPVPTYENIVLIEFAEPRPCRTLSLVWRPSSTIGEFLAELGQILASFSL